MLSSLGFAEGAREPGNFALQNSPTSNAARTFQPAIEPLVSNDLGISSGPLIAKLRNFVELEGDDIDGLERLCRSPRTYAAEQSLIQEGSGCGYVCIVMSGWAYRYKMLQNGHRQILGYLIPGDICDLSFTLLDRADYSVSVLVESRIVRLPIAQLSETLARSRNVRRAIELAAHLDGVIMRQWLVNIGQRKAHQKLGCFLFEMTERLRMLGDGSQDGWIDFPLSQSMLADTIGTTEVHVNRTLQRLRREGVIALHRRRLKILDAQKLISIANFEGKYLNSIDYVNLKGVGLAGNPDAQRLERN